MKKNIRYRPSKANAAMSLVVGILFIIIGVTLVIPATFSSGLLPIGLFGLVWTGLAVVITVVNAQYLLGKRSNTSLYGGFEITDEDEPESASPSFRHDPPDHQHITSAGLDAKSRLEQLETLKTAGLITAQEYDQKRQEILTGL